MLALFTMLVAGIMASWFWSIGWEYLHDPVAGLLLEPVIGNSWILLNGDPLGVHEMYIYIEGDYVTTFEFVVGLLGDSY